MARFVWDNNAHGKPCDLTNKAFARRVWLPIILLALFQREKWHSLWWCVFPQHPKTRWGCWSDQHQRVGKSREELLSCCGLTHVVLVHPPTLFPSSLVFWSHAKHSFSVHHVAIIVTAPNDRPSKVLSSMWTLHNISNSFHLIPIWPKKVPDTVCGNELPQWKFLVWSIGSASSG